MRNNKMHSELMHMRGLSLERLDSFCQVVIAGGLSQAAKGNRTRVAQLSREVGDLEEVFGVELFHRTGRGMSPTEEGKELFRIFQQELRLLEDFRAKCAKQPPVVRITASNSIIHWVIAPELGVLSKRLPGTRFAVQALPTAERIAAVRNHECDFAIVRRESLTPQLKSRPLLTIQYKLIAHKQLLKRSNLEDVNTLLENLPLALPPDGDFRVRLDKATERFQIRPNVVLDAHSFTVAATAVKTGHCAAILPSVAARDFPDKDFAVISVPLLSQYAPHLCLCWNPAFVRVSQAAGKARPALLELLRSD